MKESSLLKWSIPLLVGAIALTYIAFNWPAIAPPFADLLGALL